MHAKATHDGCLQLAQVDLRPASTSLHTPFTVAPRDTSTTNTALEATVMYQCDECPAEYTSAMAAAECGEADRADDARERQWLRAHPTGRVRNEVAFN